MQETFEVRESRNRQMFRVDDEYLNGYARLCGLSATGVYLCLCRHADINQQSFPSRKLIAERLGISEATVKRAIRTLMNWNIIKVEQDKSDNGTFLHNTYTLLDKSVWKSKPRVIGDPRSPRVISDTHRGSFQTKTVGHPRPTKEAHIKGTHRRKDDECHFCSLIHIGTECPVCRKVKSKI